MKRIELCCHSKFDKRGSLLGVEEILNAAAESGAVGITDFGSISAWAALKKRAESGGAKLIFGLETEVEFRNGIHTVTLIARNAEGRNSIYRLMSQSIITDEMLFDESNRKGLLLGGSGELLYAIERGADDEELALLAEEYDFLLIDVCGNTPQQNIRLINAGKQAGVHVAAACQPHYLSTDERNSYNVLMFGKNKQTDCCERHFLSDEEMIESLSYLPPQTAQEVVFTNPQLIADKCSEFPLFDEPQVCVVPNGREKLYTLCVEKAAEYYHTDEEHLPPQVAERLLREMEFIGKTESYSVFLYLHEMLKTLGMSACEIRVGQPASELLVAFLCGITNRNPLENGALPLMAYDKRPRISIWLPSDRLDEAMQAFERSQGICTTIPDIEFRKFPASLREQYINSYESENGVCFSEQERENVADQLSEIYYGSYLVSAKRVLIPNGAADLPLRKNAKGEQELCFTYTDISEYFQMQLIAGSDMLMVLHKLSDITGVNLGSIPFTDPKIMQLFTCDNDDFPLCYGMKEFMSARSVGILTEAKPTCFEELVKVVGFMRGEQVWKNDLELLFAEGTVDIKTAPASAEGVFEYLINTGLDEETSAQIAIAVRSGRFESSMIPKLKTQNIPQWFIEFCRRVRRMLPRPNAVGIAEEIWREGYFKVYYPEVYSEVMEQYEREALGNRGVRFGKTVFDYIRRREM